VFADIGGGNGACPPDQAADANDRFHALNCFANQSTLGTVGYPCEPAPPAARNADAGGAFGACQPDGVCDGNDAFHALNAFAGVSPCQCQEGQSPLPVPPVLVPPPEQARLVLRLAESKAAVGQVMVVDVFLATGLHDLRGYQLHFGITGGQRGHLELVDLSLEPGSKSHAPAFAGLPAWSAHNLQTAQLLVGLDTPGVQVGAGAYLGTATFRPSRDAYGRFAIDLLVDRHDPQQRTFLFPTSPGASIELVEVEGVVVDVGDVAVGAQAAREQTARGPQGVTP
jgi:hypothetical protein